MGKGGVTRALDRSRLLTVRTVVCSCYATTTLALRWDRRYNRARACGGMPAGGVRLRPALASSTRLLQPSRCHLDRRETNGAEMFLSLLCRER
eukprot:6181321-Pleurochrysis_carterae.AAC.3